MHTKTEGMTFYASQDGPPPDNPEILNSDTEFSVKNPLILFYQWYLDIELLFLLMQLAIVSILFFLALCWIIWMTLYYFFPYKFDRYFF